MRLLLVMMILLFFPALEVFILFKLARELGVWFWLYYLVSTLYGYWLIQQSRTPPLPEIMKMLNSTGIARLAILFTIRKRVAGCLLLFPGVMTDAFAFLLLVSARIPTGQQPGSASSPDYIDGEWRREN